MACFAAGTGLSALHTFSYLFFTGTKNSQAYRVLKTCFNVKVSDQGGDSIPPPNYGAQLLHHFPHYPSPIVYVHISDHRPCPLQIVSA